MKARQLIEAEDKAEMFSVLLDRSHHKPWREELYALGFKPTEFDHDLGKKFPLGFHREWQGHDIVLAYLYETRGWLLRVDGKMIGDVWLNFEEFLDYLVNKVLVANLSRTL